MSDFPALDEYGVTLEQATAAEDSALAEIKADREAGRLKDFAGKRDSNAVARHGGAFQYKTFLV